MYEVNEDFLEKIKNEFKTELENRDYAYDDDAIDDIFDKWAERKQMLLSLLSKHPNWNSEKFMIQFNEDFSRELDILSARNFVCWLRKNTNMDYIILLNDDGDARHSLFFELYYCTAMYSYLPEDYYVESLNRLNENFRFRPGMKTTKVVGKICKAYEWDKLEGFNAAYAQFCDALSPIKVTRHTCISLNPVDYLLMSNGNSWSSCHYIGSESSDAGCYSSGTISYMLDAHSLIFYTVDAEYDGDQIEREHKIQRQVFGYNDFQLMQSRLYPQSNDCGANDVYTDIRNIVQKVVADCLEVPNLWIKRRVTNVVRGYGATCYDDWNCQGDLCSMSIVKGKENDSLRPMILGAEPICIECGSYHSYANNISCCYKEYSCTCCDCGLDEDDVHWVDDDPYCSYCCTWCESCQEYYANEDTVYIEDRDIYVCSGCADDCYSYCDCCEKYYHHTTWVCSEDKFVCDDCLDDYARCEDCGEYFRIEDIKECTDKETGEVFVYCEECFEEHKEEVEEVEKV